MFDRFPFFFCFVFGFKFWASSQYYITCLLPLKTFYLRLDSFGKGGEDSFLFYLFSSWLLSCYFSLEVWRQCA